MEWAYSECVDTGSACSGVRSSSRAKNRNQNLVFHDAIFIKLKSEDDLRLFESWATETYFRKCEEEPRPLNDQLSELREEIESLKKSQLQIQQSIKSQQDLLDKENKARLTKSAR